MSTRDVLRAYYVERFPALGRLPSARTLQDAFSSSELAWFRKPLSQTGSK